MVSVVPLQTCLTLCPSCFCPDTCPGPVLHFEPSLDAVPLRYDVIRSTKILSFQRVADEASGAAVGVNEVRNYVEEMNDM